MKTFLTICICAMVTAGIYGFADMAGDVKNGTMIRYDQGDEEYVDVSSGALTVGILNNNATKTQAVISETKTASKQQPEIKLIAKKKIVVKDETVVEEKEVVSVNEEKFTTDVIVDSVPKEAVKEDLEINYREFSRGAPRKHKSKKHPKE
ncbi:hypothetical protein BH11BAC7_BH11BAC7_25390 [soil metagenome]